MELTVYALLFSCVVSAQSPAQAPATLAAAINPFSLDLFGQVAREAGQENVLLSPYSVSTVLSMLLLGANGSTADEIFKSLHLEAVDTDQDIFQLFSQDLLSKLADPSLALANMLLVPQEVAGASNQVYQQYRERIRSLFKGKVYAVPFKTQGEEVRESVNKYIAENTRGLIPTILDEAPSPDTQLMLLNAIYFKDSWAKQFDPKKTNKGTFRNQGTNGVEVDFMHDEREVRILRSREVSSELVTSIELPYASGAHSMVILLPRKEDGLTRILANASSAAQLGEIIDAVSDAYDPRIHLVIPKFTLETEYDLIPALDGLGIHGIFHDGDLSGILGTQDLSVTKVLHKAVVKVDEEGTVAAAVTEADAERSGPEYFIADHPFLFVIKERASGMILFVGKVESL